MNYTFPSDHIFWSIGLVIAVDFCVYISEWGQILLTKYNFWYGVKENAILRSLVIILLFVGSVLVADIVDTKNRYYTAGLVLLLVVPSLITSLLLRGKNG